MELLPVISAAAAEAVALYLITKCRCVLAPDIHKAGQPRIPKIGGLGLIIAIPFLWLLWNPVSRVAVAFFSVPLVMGVVGLLDDIYSINEYVRVAVSLGYPVALYAVDLMPRMIYVPLIGRFSDALLVGAITVASYLIFSNAVNMFDVVNGVVPFSMSLIPLSSLVYGVVADNEIAVYLSIASLAASLVLFVFNAYPAKLFNGNGGTHVLGAILSGLFLYTGASTFVLIAALPYIVNGILIIFSSRGIKGRDKLSRPTKVVNGLVYPNEDSRGVLTLVKSIVMDGPRDEWGIIKAIYALFLASFALSLLTIYLWRLI